MKLFSTWAQSYYLRETPGAEGGRKAVASLFPLKLALLFFWAAWFSIVFATNVASALKSSGRLPPSWKFASRNYEWVCKAVSIYSAPAWVPRLLFLGVLAWQLITALLFWVALAASGGAGLMDMGLVNAASTAGILLWAAFMIADEITIKYAMEQPHELLFVAQLASLVVMHVI